jgi:hypothetical protein
MNSDIVESINLTPKDYETAIEVLLQSNMMLVRQLELAKEALEKADEVGPIWVQEITGPALTEIEKLDNL